MELNLVCILIFSRGLSIDAIASLLIGNTTTLDLVWLLLFTSAAPFVITIPKTTFMNIGYEIELILTGIDLSSTHLDFGRGLGWIDNYRVRKRFVRVMVHHLLFRCCGLLLISCLAPDQVLLLSF